MSLSSTGKLACKLVKQPSITPDDAGCQFMLADRLTTIGFNNQHLRFAEVDNLWASRGNSGPCFVFAGHTDVVPTGPQADWLYPPFSATVSDGMLYGRGAADMKGSIAAFVTACERYIKRHPEHSGQIGLLITSDEEGPAKSGTKAVIEHLHQQGKTIDYCLVGEPSSSHRLGDIVKVGRRGSLNGTLTINGKQGHIAYPHLADNPLHRAIPALHRLIDEVWDLGNEDFDPTRFQMSNINAGTGASNVIPGDVEIDFNFRFSPEITEQKIRARTAAILSAEQVDFSIDWDLSGQPFQTRRGVFTDLVCAAIEDVTGYLPESSTSGGTSDGRFIAPTGTQVIELGPINATIHQINECVSLSDLDLLSTCYEKILGKILTSSQQKVKL